MRRLSTETVLVEPRNLLIQMEQQVHQPEPVDSIPIYTLVSESKDRAEMFMSLILLVCLYAGQGSDSAGGTQT